MSSNFSIEIAIKSQKILNNMLFEFCKSLMNHNNYFILNTTNIIIIKNGNYIINISCEFDQDVIVELNINNKNINKIESENNLLSFHDILKLNKYDNINIKNSLNSDININNCNHNRIKLIKI
jgi:hypothetical protein